MLGGPLIAVVNAQAQAAVSSVNFIKSVGFHAPAQQQQHGTDTEVGDPIYVKFTYPKEVQPYQPAIAEQKDADGNVVQEAVDAVDAKWENHELSVPILTMLPIPFIRIEETTIDFNAKITSVETRNTDESLKIDGSLEAKAGWLWGSAKLKVSSSYQKKTQTGSEVNRTYSMAVHIRAVQDEMPAGMERVLGVLESAIKGQPKGDGGGE